MDTSAIIESFIEFKDDKNIDRITLMGLLEQAFRALLIKQYGSDENFDIVVNANKGDLQIFHNKMVVEDTNLDDDHSEIALSEALKIEDDFEIGDEVAIEKKNRRFWPTSNPNIKTKSYFTSFSS